MRSLFLKIFFVYWLANITVFATVFAILRWTGVGAGVRQHAPMFAAMDRALGEEAVGIYERQGRDGLAGHIAEIKRRSGMDVYLLDSAGRDLAGRAVPPAVRAAADERGTTVKGAGGEPYGVVAAPPEPPLDRLVLPFSLLAVAIGVVSYWIARHVAAPVQRLRAVSQQIGEGQLGARVGPAVGGRKDALGDLGRDFDLMAEQLQALVDSHQRLLRDVSHELRSPLARLNVALGLAERQAGSGAADALREIECEAARLNDLIGRLLTVSRLEAQPAGVERTPLDLAELVRRIAEDANYEAQVRGCQVRVVDGAPLEVAGDPELLHSAIENVVRNALRYTVEGTDVEITIMRSEEQAIVRVRDHGAGVPEDALTEIFRPFHRLGDARERESGGAGLGLAITERAVRVHGGSVSAANAPDGGLVVELRLPIDSAAACPAARRPPRSE